MNAVMRPVVVMEADVRRIWAALSFVDASSARAIDAPLDVRADGARFVRNRAGLFVLMSVDQPAARRDEFAVYETAFEPVPVAAAFSVAATVRDPLQRYLPRRFVLELPRADVPPGRAAPRFVPQAVVLDPAPSASVQPTWAVLRVSVRHLGQPAANAVLRLQGAGGGSPLGRGMSDARGEALVVAAGIAQVNVGAGALVVVDQLAAELVVSHDPAADAALPIDPDELATRAGVLRRTLNLNLASGRSAALRIDLP